FKSITQACIAAGLIHQPKALNALKRAWKAAMAADRKEFQRWIVKPSAPASAPASLVDQEGCLPRLRQPDPSKPVPWRSRWGTTDWMVALAWQRRRPTLEA